MSAPSATTTTSTATSTAAATTALPKMEYVKLGKTGLEVSRVCLGCMSYGSPSWVFWGLQQNWILNREQSLPYIKRAIELGINFFDTADIYSDGESEAVLGWALKELKVKREDVVIATKVFAGPPKPNARGLSRKHIMASIDGSLKRLQTDFVDLYQIHRWDPDTPIEETMEALHDCVKAGKVRYIGASSMYTWQFAKANAIAEKNGWTRFVSMQGHYNLVYREEEREMNPYCAHEGIALIPWSPLARGFLCGNRKPSDKEKKDDVATARIAADVFATQNYYDADNFAIVERLQQLATKLGRPPAQVALAWLMSKQGVAAPIIGATKPGHIEDAVAALSIKLTDEQVKSLEELYKPRKVLPDNLINKATSRGW